MENKEREGKQKGTNIGTDKEEKEEMSDGDDPDRSGRAEWVPSLRVRAPPDLGREDRVKRWTHPGTEWIRSN